MPLEQQQQTTQTTSKEGISSGLETANKQTNPATGTGTPPVTPPTQGGSDGSPTFNQTGGWNNPEQRIALPNNQQNTQTTNTPQGTAPTSGGMQQTPATLNVRDEQVSGKTFGEKGTVGEQAATDKAKAMRDATVDERALELAKLLQQGQASDNDKLFGTVIRWLNDNEGKELAGKYTAATQKVYNKSSILLTDLTSVFGSNPLRILYLKQRLAGTPSFHAQLATALGLMGTGLFTEMFSGENADAMGIIRSQYTVKTIDELINKTDPFAAAAYTKMNDAMKAEVLSFKESLKSKDELSKATTDDGKKAAKEKLLKSNDAYLQTIIDRIVKDSTLSRVNGDQLQKDIKDWADRASEEERQGAMNGAFMKSLQAMADSWKPNGVDKKLVQNVQRILTDARPSAEQKEALQASAMFSELKKVTIEQSNKNGLTRWKENKQTGEKFKALLFSEEIKSPQSALITKFAPEIIKDIKDKVPPITDPKNDAANQKILNAYQLIKECVYQARVKALFPDSKGAPAANVELTATNLTTIYEKGEKDLQEAILEAAKHKLRFMMKQANVKEDTQLDIEETINSDGAKGTAYQTLAKIAADKKGLTNIGIGDDVLEVLKDVPADSLEFKTIKQDEKMLQAIKTRVVGRFGFGDKDWQKIATLLGLKDDLATPYKGIDQETIKNFDAQRQESRAKILTPQEKEQQAKDLENNKKQAGYWSEKLAMSYEKGLFVNDYSVMEMVFQAKKSGANWDEVLNLLMPRSFKAFQYVSNATKTADGKTKDIKAKDLMNVLSERNALRRDFDQNDSMKRLRALVKDMSISELMNEYFSSKDAGGIELSAAFEQIRNNEQKALEEAQDNVTKLELTQVPTDELEKAKTVVQTQKVKLTEKKESAIQNYMKNLDVSPETIAQLNKILDPQNAFEIKNSMRDKVAQGLSSGDKDAIASLNKLGFAKEDISLLVENIRAIALNEKELQSKTGVQYSSFTSRGLARDIATADHAKALANAQDGLVSQNIAKLTPEERAKKKADVASKLQQTGDEKQSKTDAFEERKKQFDERITSVVTELTAIIVKFATIPLSAIPILPGVVEAAINSLTQGLLKKALGGDRVGSWETVFKDMGKDFVVNAALSILKDIMPMLSQFTANFSADLVGKATGSIQQIQFLQKPLQAVQQVGEYSKNFDELLERGLDKAGLKKIREVVDKVDGFVSGLKGQLSENQGLLGKVIVAYSEDKVSELSGKAQSQIDGVTGYVTELRDKVIEEMTDKNELLGKLASTVVKIKETAGVLQGAYDTVQQGNEGIQQEKAGATLSPEMTKAITDFKTLAATLATPALTKLNTTVENAEAPKFTAKDAAQQEFGKDPIAEVGTIVTALNAQGKPVPDVLKAIAEGAK